MHWLVKWVTCMLLGVICAAPAHADVRYAKNFTKGERARLDWSMNAALEMFSKIADLTDRTDVQVTIMKTDNIEATIKEYREERGMKPLGESVLNQKGFERLAVTMVSPSARQLIRIVILDAICDEHMLAWLQHVLQHELLHAWFYYQDYLNMVKPVPGYKQLPLDSEELLIHTVVCAVNTKFVQNGRYREMLAESFPDMNYDAFSLQVRTVVYVHLDSAEFYRKRVAAKSRQSAVPRGAAAFFLL